MKAFPSALAMTIVATVTTPFALNGIGCSAADRTSGDDLRRD